MRKSKLVAKFHLSSTKTYYLATFFFADTDQCNQRLCERHPAAIKYRPDEKITDHYIWWLVFS
jgi:hypothetical protein